MNKKIVQRVVLQWKKLLVFVMLICLMQAPILAGANQEIYREEFEDSSEMAYYWLVDDANAFGAIGSDGGFEIKDGYLRAQWLNGRTLRYIENVSDYILEFDWKTGGNANPEKSCYKGALGLRLPEDYSYAYKELAICEPDNTDNDPTSYLGAVGIYLYAYGGKLDIGIHTIDETRDLGVKSEIYSFSLPDGQSFDAFTHMKIVDAKQEILIYAADVLLGTVKLDALKKEFTAKQYTGPSYTNVKVFNADGQEVLSVENAVVPPEGSFAFTNRACWYELDNLVLFDNTPPTPETEAPTSAVSATPSAKPETTATAKVTAVHMEMTGTAEDSNGFSETGIIAVLIVCLAIIAGIIVFIMHKKRQADRK